MLKDFLISSKEGIVFNGTYMEAYIPRFFFNGKYAEMMGSNVDTFGLFNICVFDSKMKPMKLETFNVPTMLTLYHTEIEAKKLTLVGSDEEEEYIVCKFHKGNKLMDSELRQDSSYLKMFMQLVCSGKIPTTVAYNDIILLWHKNLELNSTKFGVTSVIMEVFIREMCRDKNTPEEVFAKTIGKNPSMSQHAYITAGMREICAQNSTFAAMTSEDLDSMIAASLVMNKKKKKETVSPVEKIIKM